MPPKAISSKPKGKTPLKTGLKKSPPKKKTTALSEEVEEELDEVIKEVEEKKVETSRKRKQPPKKKKGLASSSDEDPNEEPEEETPDFENYEPPLWRPRFLRDEPIRCVLIGKSKSGKSYLLKYLLQNFLVPTDRYDIAFIISNSLNEQKEYGEIFTAYGIPVVCKNLRDYPLGLYDSLQDSFKRTSEEGLEPVRACLILDDFGTKDVVNGKVGSLADDIDRFMCSGRHIKAETFLLCQAPRMVSQTQKGQTSITIITKVKNMQQIDVLLAQVLPGSVDLPISYEKKDEKVFYKKLLAKYAWEVGDTLVYEDRGPEERGNREKTDLFRFRADPKSEWIPLPELPEE